MKKLLFALMVLGAFNFAVWADEIEASALQTYDGGHYGQLEKAEAARQSFFDICQNLGIEIAGSHIQYYPNPDPEETGRYVFRVDYYRNLPLPIQQYLNNDYPWGYDPQRFEDLIKAVDSLKAKGMIIIEGYTYPLGIIVRYIDPSQL